MPRADYIQYNDDLFNAQMQTFKNGIGGYATLLGVTPAQVAMQANDADCFNYILQCQDLMLHAGQQWTAWKKIERNGGTPLASGAPVLPTLPALPATVAVSAPGIEGRFRALVQVIKASPNYNAAIGEALGIEGSQQAGPNLATVQPQIDAVLIGGAVNVKWGWNGNAAFLDLCEIHVDRGDGKGFTLLTYDTTPNYTDTTPLPATPAKWTYKAIYRLGDAQVGLWSNPVTITVGG